MQSLDRGCVGDEVLAASSTHKAVHAVHVRDATLQGKGKS